MIFISFLGLTFRENNKKYFYLPIGIVGVFLIIEKEYNRKIKRKDILNKIKNYQKNK